MRDGKSRSKINDKISFQVTKRTLPGIHNQVSFSKDHGARSNIGSSELHGNLEHRKQIHNGSEGDEGDGCAYIYSHAVCPQHWEEEEQRIYEQSSESRGQENAVPFVDKLPVGVENLLPPWLMVIVE